MWAGPVSNWLGGVRGNHRARRAGHRAGSRSGDRRVRRSRRPAVSEHTSATRRRSGSRRAWTKPAAADDIDISDFRDWGDPERIAVNVATSTASSTRGCPRPRRPSCSSGWPSGAPATNATDHAGGALPRADAEVGGRSPPRPSIRQPAGEDPGQARRPRRPAAGGHGCRGDRPGGAVPRGAGHRAARARRRSRAECETRTTI